MPISTPKNFTVTQANGQILVQWDLTPTAVSYTVARSINQGVTYTNIATITAISYLDTSVTLGTEYTYTVTAFDGSTTSPPTSPLSEVPTPAGEMSLLAIRNLAKQRADMESSNFIKKSEWNNYINQSMYELYDLLVTAYEDYFTILGATFNTDGVNSSYAIPNGTNYNGAPALYKLMGLDLGLPSASNGFVSIEKYNFSERNKYFYPNTSATLYGVYNLQYRMLNNQINFIPLPSANQPIRIWYIPRLRPLLQDSDTTTDSISGWIEYVIIDAAIKALQKEESDTSALMAQKAALKARIEETAINRDAGRPDTITDVRKGTWGGTSGSGQWGPF